MMVATVLEPDLEGVRAAVRALEPTADGFEVRLDACRHPMDLGAVRGLTPKPLIATCRRPAEGGQYAGPETDRLALLEAALAAGFDQADVEGPTQLPVPEERLVRSIHNPQPLDSEAARRLASQLAARGAVAKVAAPVPDFAARLALLRAQALLTRNGVPAAVMGLGSFPRPLAHVLGSRLVYGGARTNAPGQPSLEDVVATLRRWGSPRPARRLFLVAGAPVAHSLSPRIHNAAFHALGIEAAYAALEVASRDELRRLLEAAPDLGLEGLSVTAPLKEPAYALAAEATPEAARARSANALRLDGGKVRAHNTDGLGTDRILRRLAPPRTPHPEVLLLGTGGAARGLLAQVRHVRFTVAGRNPSALETLSREFGIAARPLAGTTAEGFDVVVNATSVEDPIRLHDVRAALFDLHYAAQPTVWARHAQEHGLSFAGGRELLLEQAVDAFAFWTGRQAPRAAMAAALEAPP